MKLYIIKRYKKKIFFFKNKKKVKIFNKIIYKWNLLKLDNYVYNYVFVFILSYDLYYLVNHRTS